MEYFNGRQCHWVPSARVPERPTAKRPSAKHPSTKHTLSAKRDRVPSRPSAQQASSAQRPNLNPRVPPSQTLLFLFLLRRVPPSQTLFGLVFIKKGPPFSNFILLMFKFCQNAAYSVDIWYLICYSWLLSIFLLLHLYNNVLQII